MLKTREYQAFIDLLYGRNVETLNNVDQKSLFEMFQRHRLLSTISEEFFDLLDPKIRVRWREAIRSHTLRSMQITAVLEELVKELDKKGLGVFSIKGPVLSQRLYKDIGKRHYNDLDLVVRREQFLEIVMVLEGKDYKLAHPNDGLTLEQWDYYFKYKKDVALLNRENDVVIELHLGIFRQELIRKGTEIINWASLVEERIGSVQVKCLNLNISFLYLIYHGGQHQYFRLFWLNDIAEALGKWDLNHKWIMEKASDLGIDRLLGMGLLLSKEFFGTKIPLEYDYYLKKNRSALLKLKEICIKRIFGPERETKSWKLKRYRFVFLLQPGIKYFISILTNIIHRRHIRRKLGGF